MENQTGVEDLVDCKEDTLEQLAQDMSADAITIAVDELTQEFSAISDVLEGLEDKSTCVLNAVEPAGRISDQMSQASDISAIPGHDGRGSLVAEGSMLSQYPLDSTHASTKSSKNSSAFGALSEYSLPQTTLNTAGSLTQEPLAPETSVRSSLASAEHNPVDENPSNDLDSPLTQHSFGREHDDSMTSPVRAEPYSHNTSDNGDQFVPIQRIDDVIESSYETEELTLHMETRKEPGERISDVMESFSSPPLITDVMGSQDMDSSDAAEAVRTAPPGYMSPAERRQVLSSGSKEDIPASITGRESRVSNCSRGAVDRASNSSRGAVDRASSSSRGAADRASSSSRGAVDRASSSSRGAADRASSSSRGAVDRASSSSRGAVDRASNSSRGAVDRASNSSRGAVDRASNSSRGAVDRASNSSRNANLDSESLKEAKRYVTPRDKSTDSVLIGQLPPKPDKQKENYAEVTSVSRATSNDSKEMHLRAKIRREDAMFMAIKDEGRLALLSDDVNRLRRKYVDDDARSTKSEKALSSHRSSDLDELSTSRSRSVMSERSSGRDLDDRRSDNVTHPDSDYSSLRYDRGSPASRSDSHRNFELPRSPKSAADNAAGDASRYDDYALDRTSARSSSSWPTRAAGDGEERLPSATRPLLPLTGGGEEAGVVPPLLLGGSDDNLDAGCSFVSSDREDGLSERVAAILAEVPSQRSTAKDEGTPRFLPLFDADEGGGEALAGAVSSGPSSRTRTPDLCAAAHFPGASPRSARDVMTSGSESTDYMELPDQRKKPSSSRRWDPSPDASVDSVEALDRDVNEILRVMEGADSESDLGKRVRDLLGEPVLLSSNENLNHTITSLRETNVDDYTPNRSASSRSMTSSTRSFSSGMERLRPEVRAPPAGHEASNPNKPSVTSERQCDAEVQSSKRSSRSSSVNYGDIERDLADIQDGLRDLRRVGTYLGMESDSAPSSARDLGRRSFGACGRSSLGSAVTVSETEDASTHHSPSIKWDYSADLRPSAEAGRFVSKGKPKHVSVVNPLLTAGIVPLEDALDIIHSSGAVNTSGDVSESLDTTRSSNAAVEEIPYSGSSPYSSRTPTSRGISPASRGISPASRGISSASRASTSTANTPANTPTSGYVPTHSDVRRRRSPDREAYRVSAPYVDVRDRTPIKSGDVTPDLDDDATEIRNRSGTYSKEEASEVLRKQSASLTSSSTVCEGQPKVGRSRFEETAFSKQQKSAYQTDSYTGDARPLRKSTPTEGTNAPAISSSHVSPIASEMTSRYLCPSPSRLGRFSPSQLPPSDDFLPGRGNKSLYQDSYDVIARSRELRLTSEDARHSRPERGSSETSLPDKVNEIMERHSPTRQAYLYLEEADAARASQEVMAQEAARTKRELELALEERDRQRELLAQERKMALDLYGPHPSTGSTATLGEQPFSAFAHALSTQMDRAANASFNSSYTRSDDVSTETKNSSSQDAFVARYNSWQETMKAHDSGHFPVTSHSSAVKSVPTDNDSFIGLRNPAEVTSYSEIKNSSDSILHKLKPYRCGGGGDTYYVDSCTEDGTSTARSEGTVESSHIDIPKGTVGIYGAATTNELEPILEISMEERASVSARSPYNNAAAEDFYTPRKSDMSQQRDGPMISRPTVTDARVSGRYDDVLSEEQLMVEQARKRAHRAAADLEVQVLREESFKYDEQVRDLDSKGAGGNDVALREVQVQEREERMREAELRNQQLRDNDLQTISGREQQVLEHERHLREMELQKQAELEDEFKRHQQQRNDAQQRLNRAAKQAQMKMKIVKDMKDTYETRQQRELEQRKQAELEELQAQQERRLLAQKRLNRAAKQAQLKMKVVKDMKDTYAKRQQHDLEQSTQAELEELQAQQERRIEAQQRLNRAVKQAHMKMKIVKDIKGSHDERRRKQNEVHERDAVVREKQERDLLERREKEKTASLRQQKKSPRPHISLSREENNFIPLDLDSDDICANNVPAPEQDSATTDPSYSMGLKPPDPTAAGISADTVLSDEDTLASWSLTPSQYTSKIAQESFGRQLEIEQLNPKGLLKNMIREEERQKQAQRSADSRRPNISSSEVQSRKKRTSHDSHAADVIRSSADVMRAEPIAPRERSGQISEVRHSAGGVSYSFDDSPGARRSPTPSEQRDYEERQLAFEKQQKELEAAEKAQRKRAEHEERETRRQIQQETDRAQAEAKKALKKARRELEKQRNDADNGQYNDENVMPLRGSSQRQNVWRQQDDSYYQDDVGGALPRRYLEETTPTRSSQGQRYDRQADEGERRRQRDSDDVFYTADDNSRRSEAESRRKAKPERMSRADKEAKLKMKVQQDMEETLKRRNNNNNAGDSDERPDYNSEPKQKELRRESITRRYNRERSSSRPRAEEAGPSFRPTDRHKKEVGHDERRKSRPAPEQDGRRSSRHPSEREERKMSHRPDNNDERRSSRRGTEADDRRMSRQPDQSDERRKSRKPTVDMGDRRKSRQSPERGLDQKLSPRLIPSVIVMPERDNKRSVSPRLIPSVIVLPDRDDDGRLSRQLQGRDGDRRKSYQLPGREDERRKSYQSPGRDERRKSRQSPPDRDDERTFSRDLESAIVMPVLDDDRRYSEFLPERDDRRRSRSRSREPEDRRMSQRDDRRRSRSRSREPEDRRMSQRDDEKSRSLEQDRKMSRPAPDERKMSQLDDRRRSRSREQERKMSRPGPDERRMSHRDDRRPSTRQQRTDEVMRSDYDEDLQNVEFSPSLTETLISDQTSESDPDATPRTMESTGSQTEASSMTETSSTGAKIRSWAEQQESLDSIPEDQAVNSVTTSLSVESVTSTSVDDSSADLPMSRLKAKISRQKEMQRLENQKEKKRKDKIEKLEQILKNKSQTTQSDQSSATLESDFNFRMEYEGMDYPEPQAKVRRSDEGSVTSSQRRRHSRRKSGSRRSSKRESASKSRSSSLIPVAPSSNVELTVSQRRLQQLQAQRDLEAQLLREAEEAYDAELNRVQKVMAREERRQRWAQEQFVAQQERERREAATRNAASPPRKTFSLSTTLQLADDRRSKLTRDRQRAIFGAGGNAGGVAQQLEESRYAARLRRDVEAERKAAEMERVDSRLEAEMLAQEKRRREERRRQLQRLKEERKAVQEEEEWEQRREEEERALLEEEIRALQRMRLRKSALRRNVSEAQRASMQAQDLVRVVREPRLPPKEESRRDVNRGVKDLVEDVEAGTQVDRSVQPSPPAVDDAGRKDLELRSCSVQTSPAVLNPEFLPPAGLTSSEMARIRMRDGAWTASNVTGGFGGRHETPAISVPLTRAGNYTRDYAVDFARQHHVPPARSPPRRMNEWSPGRRIFDEVPPPRRHSDGAGPMAKSGDLVSKHKVVKSGFSRPTGRSMELPADKMLARAGHSGFSWFVPVPRQAPAEPLRERQSHDTDASEAWKARENQARENEVRENEGETDEDGAVPVSKSSSLQDAFAEKRGSFVTRSLARMHAIKLRAAQRRLHQARDPEDYAAERRALLQAQKDQENIPPHILRLIGAEKRNITKFEMKERSAKVYKNLPEVRQAEEKRKNVEAQRTNRLRANMYKEKILSHVLSRR